MNSMKRLVFAAMAMVASQFAFGQSVAFTGRTIDSTGAALDMVSVAVLTASDSTVESFTFSNPDGTFQTDRIGVGEYILQLSFLGYGTHSEKIKVGENGTAANRGDIILSPEMNVLSEVVVNGQRIPVLINKDTVEYDASAFRVRADDNVEDLLKKLPGVDVDRDGTITAQGQKVEQVLVDGKEFFSGDPTVATRNIPADAVKSVQVYDRQTDEAKYTGVDDGERSKTINLELKEDRKNGYFGYAEGGGGVADNRVPFMAKGGIHRFTATTRLSVLANMNNVNDYGFSFGDYRDMAGASSGGRGGFMITMDGTETIPLSWGGPNDGQYFSGAAGVNLNWDPNKNHRFNSSYFFTHLDNFTNTIQNSEEFANDRTIYGYRESEDNSVLNNHAFSLSHRSDLDSMNRVEIKASGRYQAGFSNSSTYETRRLDTVGMLQISDRSAYSEDMNVSAQGSLNYIHKFKTKGRIMSITGGLTTSDKESDGIWNNYNQFPIEGTIDSLNQARKDNTSSMQYNASATYTEPIAKNHFLEGTVSMSTTDETLIRETRDANSGGLLVDYSPTFTLTEGNQTGRVAYRYTGSAHNIDVGVRAARYTQSAVEERFATTIPMREFVYALPYVNYNWSISTFSRVGANYSTSVDMPELTQLLTLLDITNPLVKYVGNPNLEPQVSHNMWMHYGRWNSFDGSGFFASISGGRTDNVISTDQTIDSNYVRIFRPENYSEPAYRVSADANYRFTIKRLGMSTRVRVNGGYNQSPNSLNGELNIQSGSNVGGQLSFRNTNQEFFGYSFGGELNYNWSFYSLQEQLNQEYLSHSYFANVEWTPNKRFGIETGVDLQTYTNASFADDQFVPVWNANVRYNLSKDGTAQFELTVFDILNQNRGINRYATLNSIVETQTNSLGRYVMLTFLYKFNSAGGSGGQNGPPPPHH
ncbi:MAG: TonB-dependent receptor [Bacteroidetes bacterium]|nr:MAG: TonB-dependent receptor [Bacteroidota bacterium]